MWLTYPHASLESWLQISPTSIGPTGPATESGFISDPTKLGGWDSIVVPASGGDAIAMSKDIDGVSPQESFDGDAVYFASHSTKWC